MHEDADIEPDNSLAGFGSTALEVLKQPNAETLFFYPFLNASMFQLMSWFYIFKALALASLEQLVYVILAPDFKPGDFEGFSAACENRYLDNLPTSESNVDSSALPSCAISDI